MRRVVHVHLHRAGDAADLWTLYEELADRMWRCARHLESRTGDAAWHEEQHPRAPDGRFGHRSGEHPDADAPAVKGGGMHAVHALLSTGRPFTKQELLDATGLKEKRLGDYLAMLKNPKYAKPGVLNIARLEDGRYQVQTASGKPAPPVPFDVRKEWDRRFVRVQPPMPPAPRPPAPAPAPAPVPQPRSEAPARPKGPPKEWAPAKTAREASERAVREGYATSADFGRMSPEAANEYMTSLADHFAEFPALRSYARLFVGTNAGYVKRYVARKSQEVAQALLAKNPAATADDIARHVKWYVRKPRMSTKAWAYAWRATGSDAERAVTFNEKFSTDLKASRESLARCVATGFHPPGCDTHRSVMDHELGHQLDYMLDLCKHPEIARMYSETLHAGVRNHGVIPEDKAVSKYGRTNVAEFIAECWAEARNAREPRPTARRVAEIVRSEYAKKHGSPA